MILNLLFISMIAYSSTSLISKRCFRSVQPVVVAPQPPQPPIVVAPQPPRASQPPVIVAPPVVIPTPVTQPPVVVPTPAPVVVLTPTPQPQVVVPQNPSLKSIETGDKNLPLRNGACFYMYNVAAGQFVSFGTSSMEITLSRTNGPNEVVCVETASSNTYYIHWKNNSFLVFDIYNGGTSDGTRLIKYPKHGGPNQQFKVLRNDKGQYYFIGVHSGRALEFWQGGIVISLLKNQIPQQTWQLTPAPQPQVVVQNPALKSIETGDKNLPLRNGACFYMYNVAAGQSVSFGTSSMEITLSRTNGPNEVVCVETASSNTYFIHWRKDWLLVFDIYGSGTSDGTRLIKYPKHGGPNQQFKVLRNDKGQYYFIGVHSGRALEFWQGGIVISLLKYQIPQQTWQLTPA